jgi:hypothetical protein
MLHYLPQDMVRKELSQEVERQVVSFNDCTTTFIQQVNRHPVVERAVADLRMFSEPNFLSGIQSSLQKVLDDAKQKEKSPAEQKSS